MRPIIFSLFHEALAKSVAKKLRLELGQFRFKQFPDDESYLKIETPVKGRKVIVIDSLDRPNKKMLPLLFLSNILKDLKADSIGLCAPYLPYLRQDKRFNPGEAITAKYFSDLISRYFHWVLTVDPHLHRYKSLGEVYSIPSSVVHSTTLISNWISENVTSPVVIGPDQESEQWVASVADKINAPFVVLTKDRLGDKEVKILPP